MNYAVIVHVGKKAFAILSVVKKDGCHDISRRVLKESESKGGHAYKYYTFMHTTYNMQHTVTRPCT
jgi:hypothetical protein